MNPLILFLSRQLLQLALGAAFRRALPSVFKRLDSEIPLLLTHLAPPSKIKGTIASAISEATGHRATPPEIEAVIALYDPMKAAANLLKQRQ